MCECVALSSMALHDLWRRHFNRSSMYFKHSLSHKSGEGITLAAYFTAPLWRLTVAILTWNLSNDMKTPTLFKFSTRLTRVCFASSVLFYVFSCITHYLVQDVPVKYCYLNLYWYLIKNLLKRFWSNSGIDRHVYIVYLMIYSAIGAGSRSCYTSLYRKVCLATIDLFWVCDVCDLLVVAFDEACGYLAERKAARRDAFNWTAQ